MNNGLDGEGTLETKLDGVLKKTVVPKGVRLYVCLAGSDDDLSSEGWTLCQTAPGAYSMWQRMGEGLKLTG